MWFFFLFLTLKTQRHKELGSYFEFTQRHSKKRIWMQIWACWIHFHFVYELGIVNFTRKFYLHKVNPSRHPASRGRRVRPVFVSNWIDRVFFLLSVGFRASGATAASLCVPNNDSLTPQLFSEMPQRRNTFPSRPLLRCPLAEEVVLTRQSQVPQKPLACSAHVRARRRVDKQYEELYNGIYDGAPIFPVAITGAAEKEMPRAQNAVLHG